MNYKKTRIEAVALVLILIGAVFIIPVSSIEMEKNDFEQTEINEDETIEGYWLDRNYIFNQGPAPLNKATYDDAGYREDAGDEYSRAHILYPGEIIDDTPGRGRTGEIGDDDIEDWFIFAVCEGQQIIFTLTPETGFDYDIHLWDENEKVRASSTNGGSAVEVISHTANYTGDWLIQIVFINGTGLGTYSFDIQLMGQNDAGTSADAGDSFASATPISEGEHFGFLDMNDAYDWYKFTVDDGDGVHFILEMRRLAFYSDFDIALYNPSGEMVHKESYYYDDELYYPIDQSGDWRIELTIFPGWVDMPQPTEWNYYTYGSGPYRLTYSIESDAPAPPGPIPQPEITPISKSFIVENDPDSNKMIMVILHQFLPVIILKVVTDIWHQ